MADEFENDQGAVITEDKVRVKKPDLFRVLLHNDDYTPMDFVVDILINIFRKSHSQATQIMLSVHNQGHGICGQYPFDIAETKVAQVTEAARDSEYPLKCTLERV